MTVTGCDSSIPLTATYPLSVITTAGCTLQTGCGASQAFAYTNTSPPNACSLYWKWLPGGLVDVRVSNPKEIVNGIDEGGYDGYNIAACQEPMGLAPGQSCTISFYFAGVGGSYFPGYANTWSTSLTLEDNASSPTVNWTVFMP